MRRGRFITFEGGEGTGKSTQARLLAEALRARGIDTVLTREPGGSPLAEQLRNLILGRKPQSKTAEFLLFAAARAEHIAATIKPALERGDWVICDRYIDSTRVYQGDLEGITQDLLIAVEQHCVAPWFPDLTIVMDLPVTLSLARVCERGALSRFDEANRSRHEIIRRSFLNIAEREPERCQVVGADGTTEEVAQRVLAGVERVFPEAAPARAQKTAG